MKECKKLYKIIYAKSTYKILMCAAYTEEEAWGLADEAKERNDPRIIDDSTSDVLFTDCDIEEVQDYPKEFNGLSSYVKLAMTLRKK